jgi:hypothetical protein
MNLAWLAAVLQPRDVMYAADGENAEARWSGVAHLAGLVLGGNWMRTLKELPSDPQEAEVLQIAERCLRQDSIDDAVYELAAHLREHPPEDEAQGVALALLLCSAAAELDDFETGIRALGAQLERLSGLRGPDVQLLRAATYQQRALRARDGGEPYVNDLLEVGRILSSFDPAACSEFPTSKGVAWASRKTSADIHDGLLRAASGLYPMDEPLVDDTLLTHARLSREPWSAAEYRAWSKQADEYPRFVEQQFEKWSGTTGRVVLIGRVGADIFHALLGLELMGSRLVGPVRKNLALLRLSQDVEDPLLAADALRLLRHAGASKELSHALRRIRAAGPLAALAKDARQVLGRRLGTTSLRTVEIEVLAAASELLTKPEARRAIGAIEAALDSESGPVGIIGEWKLPVLQREVAWKALAAMAGPAQSEDRVARTLLKELEQLARDVELGDRGLRAAVLRLDWKQVAPETKHGWNRTLEGRRREFPATFEGMASFAEEAPVFPDEADPLERLASWVNAEIRGQRQDADPHLDEEVVRRAMATVREHAAMGRFSFGGANAADIAAALVSTGHGVGLWTDLAEFLMDSRVARDDRTPALDRLAFSRTAIPPEAALLIRQKANDALHAASSTPRMSMENELVPYPAALRFLSVCGFIDVGETYGYIAQLAGSGDRAARREAARTVALLALHAPREDLLSLVLPLSHDNDASVRAQVAVALAHLAATSDALAAVADGRMLQLLGEDGVEIPLMAIRALRDASIPLSEKLVAQLEWARDSHPSRSVRMAAAEAVPRD